MTSKKKKASSATPAPAAQQQADAAAAAAGGGAHAQQAAAAAAQAAAPKDPTQELQEIEARRKHVAAQLRDVERQIFDLETKYVEGCNPQCNAFRGYAALTAPGGGCGGGGGGGGGGQRGGGGAAGRGGVAGEDRLFSGSSLTGTMHLGHR
jgi:hypothetical protein